MVFGEQDAELALMLVLTMLSWPVTFTQLPICG